MPNTQDFNIDLAADELPTSFQPQTGKILVTGASGYIGGRLVYELLARGYKVRVMLRANASEYKKIWPEVEIVIADALKINDLRKALKGIDTAYYLIHSLTRGPKVFPFADMQVAGNFRHAAEEMNINRIIYLGGLGDVRSSLSSHLRSRVEVAEELKRGAVPVTVLRAAVIVGAGSASYEIIKHLAKKLYVVPVPYWANNKCQPIAIRDVIKYLIGVLEVSETTGKSFDIGGKDILTYKTMLKIMSEFIRKKIFFIPIPFFNIGFYSYITSFFTPVPASITKSLMEGLKNEVICRDETIKNFVQFVPLSYKEAIIRAMTREEQDKVHTRWSDAYPPAHQLAIKLHELENGPDYTAAYSLVTNKSSASLFKSICNIGGREGWFHSNWMWRARGMLDRILLGVGAIRGRRSYSHLKVNDVIDFWRVESLEENKELLLRAEMKLPGKAWLEFSIKSEEQKRKLNVTAYYGTKSIFGKIYWFIFLPFHHFIFHNLIKEIEKRS